MNTTTKKTLPKAKPKAVKPKTPTTPTLDDIKAFMAKQTTHMFSQLDLALNEKEICQQLDWLAKEIKIKRKRLRCGR